jgi:3-oxoacyl-[acyl-carrier protein] reductase
MEYGIKERVAIVTGASKGIGQAVARTLSSQGVFVCIVARDDAQLRKTAIDITQETGNEVIYLSADVADVNAADSMINFAISKFGKLDILVNNAGGPPPGSAMNMTEKDWDAALQLNLRSAIRASTSAIPHMRKQAWGRIVNITSTVAKEPTPNMILSATTRAALAAFAKGLSIEIAPMGITVNTVCPGGVLTDRLLYLLKSRSENEQVSIESLIEQSQKSIPIQRFATPEEFADYVVFLCSDRARYITGTYVSVDGGLTKSI